jgi:opacity protein-like surface antigen
MNRVARWILILALAACLPLGTAARADDLNVLYGQKSLSEDEFDVAGVDGQSQYGLVMNFDFDWPVVLAVDILSSSDDNTQSIVTGIEDYDLSFATEVETMELDVGVRKFWDWKIEPYVGGGIAYIQLDAKQTESGSFLGNPFSDVVLDDDDSGFGFWVGAGFLYRLGDNFNAGLDLRYSDSSADLTPVGFENSLKLDSGGTHYGIVLGYHW